MWELVTAAGLSFRDKSGSPAWVPLLPSAHFLHNSSNDTQDQQAFPFRKLLSLPMQQQFLLNKGSSFGKFHLCGMEIPVAGRASSNREMISKHSLVLRYSTIFPGSS